MAKFPITTTKRTAVSGATAVRANVSTDTAAGAVSAAIRQGAGQIAGTLQRDAAQQAAADEKNRQDRERILAARRKMMDSNSAVTATKLRQKADADFETFKLTNPQETWEAERERQAADVGTQIGGLDFSPEAAETQGLKSEAYAEVETAKALSSATRQLRTDTIDAQSEAMVDAFRSGKDVDIAESTRRFSDNGANMGKDRAEVLSDIKIAKEAGEKLRNEDAVESMRNAASLSPQAVIDQMNKLKADRKANIADSSALENTDIDSIIRSAEDRIVQLQAKGQAEVNAANTKLETELHDAIRAGDESITAVANSGLPAATKRRLEQDLDDENKRDVEKSWAIQDSKDATTGVREILLSIEGGQVDINEARNTLSQLSRRKTDDGRSIVSKDTFDKTMDKIAKGGRDAVDLFTDEQTAIVSNALVGRLTEQQARNKIRFEAGTMSGTEKRQFSTSGFLLQVAKHQEILYNNGLAQRLRALGIENTSGKEAKAEAVKVWAAIKHKPLETQINDFLVASGQKLENPQGFPQATWDAADARNRATIVNAISQGFDNKQILEAIAQ